MNIKEIYEAFDKIGVLSFATVNENGEPISRVAHLRAYDEEGIYFMSMFTKSFHKQLVTSKKVSISGLCAPTSITHDDEGLPVFEAGYSIRLTGNVKQVSIEELKSKNNPMFDMCIKDYEKYNAMTAYCITSAYGDVFNYDFEKITMDHKLERVYFSYNGCEKVYRGLVIDQEACIHCGICKNKCSFSAISENDNVYTISETRCDECGDCYINCPKNAIHSRDKHI